jgi:hypothetical protein
MGVHKESKDESKNASALAEAHVSNGDIDLQRRVDGVRVFSAFGPKCGTSPSTLIVCPVIESASGESRKTASVATSSGVPSRSSDGRGTDPPER